MIERLLKSTLNIKKRFGELETLIAAPEIIADNRLYRRLVLERADIEEAALCRKELEKKAEELESLQRDTHEDPEYKRMVEVESERLRSEIYALADKLNSLIKPDDNEGYAILEIKAEGDTSANFAYELLKMYRAAAALYGWTAEEETLSGVTEEGIKSATLILSGMGVFTRLAPETGIHRASGLDGGNASATVITLKYAPYNPVDINEKDLRIDIFHSGGAGGQNVNKVETAVRITHNPTGIVAICQDERSQLKNKMRAMDTLKEKLDGYYKKQNSDNLASQRKLKVAEAKKADKIRTYDYTLQKITDHRSGEIIQIHEAKSGKLLELTEHYHLKLF